MHIVCRPLPMGDTVLDTGTEVEADGWRNLRKLIDQRYLRPLTINEVLERQASSPAPKHGREVPHAHR